MKQIFIVANWKANNVVVKDWTEQFKFLSLQIKNDELKKIIVCPPFTSLIQVRALIEQNDLMISLGAQNISRFPQGAHTGEETGEMLKDIVDYVIIGHSERRAMGESEESIGSKLIHARKHNLTPILCISKLEEIDSQRENIKNIFSPGQIIIAYEPLQAIGSGIPDTPEHADDFGKQLKNIVGDVPVLYGGSVKGENVKVFTSQIYISGVLVGGASLKADSFYEIVKNS